MYPQGIDNAEIIETVRARRAPMVLVRTKLGRSTPHSSGTLSRTGW